MISPPTFRSNPMGVAAENGTRSPNLLPESRVATADGFLELRVWSEMFEDSQRARIACRHRAERGGVDPLLYATQIDALEKAEHMIGLAMRKCFKRVAPDQHAWMLDTPGVGEHLLARLIGCIGQPRHAAPHHWEGEGSKRILIADEPYERTVSQLWSYCGHGDPVRKRYKNMPKEEAFALGNPRAKVIVHLLAESCMKNAGSPATVDPDTMGPAPVSAGQNSQPNGSPDSGVVPAANASDGEAIRSPHPINRAPRRRSPYRDTYEAARATYVDRVHATECVRCGPSGKPAQIGSPWSDGHQHAAALRLVGKEILRDLWLIA